MGNSSSKPSAQDEYVSLSSVPPRCSSPPVPSHLSRGRSPLAQGNPQPQDPARPAAQVPATHHGDHVAGAGDRAGAGGAGRPGARAAGAAAQEVPGGPAGEDGRAAGAAGAADEQRGVCAGAEGRGVWAAGGDARAEGDPAGDGRAGAGGEVDGGDGGGGGVSAGRWARWGWHGEWADEGV